MLINDQIYIIAAINPNVVIPGHPVAIDATAMLGIFEFTAEDILVIKMFLLKTMNANYLVSGMMRLLNIFLIASVGNDKGSVPKNTTINKRTINRI